MESAWIPVIPAGLVNAESGPILFTTLPTPAVPTLPGVATCVRYNPPANVLRENSKFVVKTAKHRKVFLLCLVLALKLLIINSCQVSFLKNSYNMFREMEKNKHPIKQACISIRVRLKVREKEIMKKRFYFISPHPTLPSKRGL